MSSLMSIPGLQGHAIKNQDLLIASGTITSKGSEGLTAVDEDVQAAVSMQCSHHLVHVKTTSCSSKHRSKILIRYMIYEFVTVR